MSDETKNDEVVEPENDGDSNTGNSIGSLDDALKVIESLRKENAAKRVKAREVEEKAKKWEEYVDSQKTELEKLTESKAALEKENQELKIGSLRSKVASEEGVPTNLVQFLTASDEAGLREQAKALASAKPKEPGKQADFFAGQRGTELKPTPKGLNDFFAEMWREADQKSQKRTF